MELRAQVFRAILAFYIFVLVTLRNFENRDLFILSVIITIFSFLCMVQITLADLNYQNDIRESSESAEKRTKKQTSLWAILPDGDIFQQKESIFLFSVWYFQDPDRCFWSSQSHCLHHRKTFGFLFITFPALWHLLSNQRHHLLPIIDI